MLRAIFTLLSMVVGAFFVLFLLLAAGNSGFGGVILKALLP